MNPRVVFFVMGMVFWGGASTIIGMACFHPFCPIEVLQVNKEIAEKVSSDWNWIILKIILIWGASGGILGLVISQIFLSHPPRSELRISTQILEEKSTAEANAGCNSWVLAVLIGWCLATWVLPRLQTDLVIVQSERFRTIASGMHSLFMTVLILPFSTRIVVLSQSR